MVVLSTLALVPTLFSTPVSLQVSPMLPPTPRITVERVEHLRSLLLQRELKDQPRGWASSKPAVIN
jgi:hypothetical protein